MRESKMQERFSPQQIAKLRDEYGKISTIDPSGQAYKQLVAMLDRLELDDLKTLAGAKIKFVSGLAQNRVNRAKSKNEEVDVKEGLNEMDKTQTSPGRDGDIDWTKKQIHLGPEHVMKSKDISKHGLKILDKIMKKSQKKNVKEDTDLEESKSGTGYELYHKDFSSAMAHAYDFAKKKYNIEIDPTEIDRNVAMGPKKPSSGKANAYRLLDKTGKKAIQVQVTNLDNKRYELNMYKEDIDEACWDTHKQEGMKKKGDKMVPNCVPKNEAASPAQQAAIAIAMKKAGKKPKDMKEAVGGGTSVNTQSLKSAEAQKKRAEVAVKIAALKLKQQKERESLQKQKRSVKEEVMDVVEVEINEADKVPEYKTGGEPLAKKFEKAFAKMGIKTKIKMKTVGNVSVNEAAMKKVLSATKKKKMKEQEEAPSKKDTMKSGDALSGKREPIEINPEIENRK